MPNEVKPVESLDASLGELVRLAMEARDRAYAPYSRFKVGCAIRDDKGEVFTGCNVENASYSAVICGERVAICNMVSTGSRKIYDLVLVTEADKPCFPCGVCLQVIQEFGAGARIVALDRTGKFYLEARGQDLLPSGFTAEQMPSSGVESEA